MIAEFLIAMSLQQVCENVRSARAAGLSDIQIEQFAREHAVPERVIAIAKKKCPKA